jgi:hypothetical protein
MCKTAAKWVPHILNEVQQCTHYETCPINLEYFHHEGDVLNGINVINESGHGPM